MNKELIDWSQKNYPHLPWRKDRSLYRTLVSEIMLQQTTVSTVLKHFDRFIEQFPDVHVLASATEEEVVQAWEGLGYYRRARSLHAAAQDIVHKFSGEFPLETEQLKQIKGIGDYTASALRSIGANKKDISVDANLERVLARYYGIDLPKGPKLQKKLRERFNQNEICQNIDRLGARNLNEALMDLGRTICQARSAACEICPLKKDCVGKREPLRYASASAAKKESYELHLLRVICESEGRLLGMRKGPDHWLSGQVEIPTFTLFCHNNKFSQYPILKFEDYENLPMIKTGITKYKISNYLIIANTNDLVTMGISSQDYYWFNPEQEHFSTASLKALDFFS